VKIKCSVTIKSEDSIQLVKNLAVEKELWPFPPPKVITDAFFKDAKNGVDEDDEDD